MYTTRSLLYPVGSLSWGGLPGQRPPLQTPPTRVETPLDRDPLDRDLSLHRKWHHTETLPWTDKCLWKYYRTHINPSDKGTHSYSPESLLASRICSLCTALNVVLPEGGVMDPSPGKKIVADSPPRAAVFFNLSLNMWRQAT